MARSNEKIKSQMKEIHDKNVKELKTLVTRQEVGKIATTPAADVAEIMILKMVQLKGNGARHAGKSIIST